MKIYSWRRQLRQQLPTLSSIVFVATLASPAVSQDNTTYLEPPRGEVATSYQDAMPRAVTHDTRYVDETNIDFLTSEAAPRPRRDLTLPTNGGSSLSVIIIALIIGGLLFVFLKYGGAGALFQADPNAQKKPKKKRAKAWGLTASEESAGDILAKIRAMASRREALILLLRHCLLQAADETDVFFLRADTEREAFSRLPNNWRRITQLKNLLHRTELVHYGGRDIADPEFETALTFGAQILMEAR